MNSCPVCGTSVAFDSAFCSECGAQQLQSDIAEIANPVITPPFFSTSQTKLAIMSLCTFGLYELFWFYRNWQLIKARNGSNIMPFWRAVFAPLWAYSCFKEIQSSAKSNLVPETMSIIGLALAYFVIISLWRLPDPFYIISSLSFIAMLPANAVASEVNTKVMPGFVNNSEFSAWNWLAIIIGGLILVLGTIGSFMPDV